MVHTSSALWNTHAKMLSAAQGVKKTHFPFWRAISRNKWTSPAQVRVLIRMSSIIMAAITSGWILHCNLTYWTKHLPVYRLKLSSAEQQKWLDWLVFNSTYHTCKDVARLQFKRRQSRQVKRRRHISRGAKGAERGVVRGGGRAGVSPSPPGVESREGSKVFYYLTSKWSTSVLYLAGFNGRFKEAIARGPLASYWLCLRTHAWYIMHIQ